MYQEKHIRFPELAGKVALITGASCRIGEAIALALAHHGVAVAASGRNEARLSALVESIREGGGKAIVAVGDVTKEADVVAVRDRTERELGAVELLAAVAGGLGEPVPLAELSLERFRASVDLNLTSLFLTFKTFLPGMAQRRRGSIVTMSSLAGEWIATHHRGGASPAYSASKAGMLTLTRQAAKEYAEFGVRVNAIAPGAVLHERLEALPPERLEALTRMHPLGRVGRPEDVAEATLFLLSDASSWMTGVTMDLNGGQRMA